MSYWSASIVVALMLAPAFMAPPTAASTPVILYFASTTGLNTVDTILGVDTLSATPPSATAPAAVWSMPAPLMGSNPNTVFDANWRWRPSGGFGFWGSTVTVTFWATPVGDGAVQGNGWIVEFFESGTPIFGALATDGGALAPGPREFSVTIPNVTISGSDLTVQISPATVDAEGAHVILYGTTQFPSRVTFA